MRARDIKNQISIELKNPIIGEQMDEDILDKEIIANIGDVLVAGPQENKVVKISYHGNAYDLMIHIDNGQKIAMNQLAKLIENGQINKK